MPHHRLRVRDFWHVPCNHKPVRVPIRCLLILLLLRFLTVLPSHASPPNPIDDLILRAAKSHSAALSPLASDSEFLRRVYLDLVGTIPTSSDARTFLADPSPNKRTDLIDRLMADPRFPQRMAEALDILWMERRGDDDAWMKYLADSVRMDKPLDLIVREILRPDFNSETIRGAGFFLTKRLDKVGQQETDYPGLTRDVGRLFLGVDLQCAQCHKHLTVNDYKQIDFNGLFAVFQNLKLNEPSHGAKSKWVSEGLLTAKLEFTSVLNGNKGATGPRVPFSDEVPLPELPEDQRWLTPPDKKTKHPGIPRFSPLQALSERVTSPDNTLFARNMANRLWWMLTGRGLVEPLDLHHSDNPPSHPELLDALSRDLIDNKFQLKPFLKSILLSSTYQRSSMLPDSATPTADTLFTTAIERPLHAEQLARAFLTATTGFPKAPDSPQTVLIGTKSLKTKDVMTAFKKAFANAPREPELAVNPSLRGALFIRNNPLVLDALMPGPDHLLSRLIKEPSTERVAEELFLSVLTRHPDADEIRVVAQTLAEATTEEAREVACRNLAWAALASIEFFTNH